MVGLDFSGRWYTRNGTLVAVHRNEDSVGNRVGEWWGHLLVPYIDDRLIYWDEKGDCVKESIQFDLHRLDLVTAVNREKQSQDFNMVCDCKECVRWQRGY
jgi:hypothetical protein